MKKLLQGIALILFGILLGVSEPNLNSTVLSDFADFPFALFGVAIGAAGLVLAFQKAKDRQD